MGEHKKDFLKDYEDDLEINEKVMIAIVKVSETFKKNSDMIFKNYGLTFSQYNALRVLNNSKNGQNSVTNTSKIMIVSGPNLTGIAKRLEKNGFILRKKDSKDERITLLEITPKGKQVLTKISAAKDENISHYLKNFSGEEKKKMLLDLKRIFNKRALNQK